MQLKLPLVIITILSATELFPRILQLNAVKDEGLTNGRFSSVLKNFVLLWTAQKQIGYVCKCTIGSRFFWDVLYYWAVVAW